MEEPKGPRVGLGDDFDDVGGGVGEGERGIVGGGEDLVESRVFPIDLGGGAVDEPLHERAVVGRGGGVEAERDVLHGRGELVLGDGVVDIGADNLIGARGGFVDEFGRLLRRIGDGGSFVSDDTEDFARIGVDAAVANVCSQPVVADGLVGGEDDVGSLANVDVDRCGDVGLDGHKVGGDDGEVVLIDGDDEVVVDPDIDESDAETLALGHFSHMVGAHIVGSFHRSVDQGGIGHRGPCGTMQGADVVLKCRVIVPVREGHGAQIRLLTMVRNECHVSTVREETHIVVADSRPIDDDASRNTVSVLGRVVTVIPRCAELRAAENVLSRLTRGKRTFGDAANTVVLYSVELAKAVPVHRRAIVLQGVFDIDNHPVAPVRNQSGTSYMSVSIVGVLGQYQLTILTIDSQNEPIESIRRKSGHIRDFQIVNDIPARLWKLCIKVSGNGKAIGPAGSSIGGIGAGCIAGLRTSTIQSAMLGWNGF